jgi:hypothetical protein
MRAALLADVAEVRVTSQTARVHFLACDRTGACAAVELVGGRQVVTTGEAMPWRVLTNSTYAESRAFTARRGGSALPAGAGSLERFARAAALSRAAADRDTGAPGLADDAFALLDSVSQGAGSVWNIVYDPVRLLVRFRTHAEPRSGSSSSRRSTSPAPQAPACSTSMPSGGAASHRGSARTRLPPTATCSSASRAPGWSPCPPARSTTSPVSPRACAARPSTLPRKYGGLRGSPLIHFPRICA